VDTEENDKVAAAAQAADKPKRAHVHRDHNRARVRERVRVRRSRAKALAVERQQQRRTWLQVSGRVVRACVRVFVRSCVRACVCVCVCVRACERACVCALPQLYYRITTCYSVYRSIDAMVRSIPPRNAEVTAQCLHVQCHLLLQKVHVYACNCVACVRNLLSLRPSLAQ
jgi:hypothetical protein